MKAAKILPLAFMHDDLCTSHKVLNSPPRTIIKISLLSRFSRSGVCFNFICAAGIVFFYLDNGVCQLSAGHAAREASRSVPVCYVGDQFQTELSSVQDALKHLHHPKSHLGVDSFAQLQARIASLCVKYKIRRFASA